MMRWAPKSAAEFITAFSDGNAQFGDSTWLVWTYEGDYTLADLMVVSRLQKASMAASCWVSVCGNAVGEHGSTVRVKFCAALTKPCW